MIQDKGKESMITMNICMKPEICCACVIAYGHCPLNYSNVSDSVTPFV